MRGIRMTGNRVISGLTTVLGWWVLACGSGRGEIATTRPEVAVTFPDSGFVGREDVANGSITESGDFPQDVADASVEDDGEAAPGPESFVVEEDVSTDEAGADNEVGEVLDPGKADAGCQGDEDCPPGYWCDEHACSACDTSDHCGVGCVPCGPGLQCWLGKCVECVASADCGPARWCDGGTCVPCSDDDPKHCGVDCEPCLGERPACVAGECVCTEVSCGSGRRCVEGECRACDTAEACGPQCVACETPTPHCQSASGGCVACLDMSHCGEDEACLGGVCVNVCAPVKGCTTDEGPDGKKCSTAKVIGRAAAQAGYVHHGDTTGDKNNDDLSFPIFQDKSECWDANEDNFFRLYLLAGERLDITLNPKDPVFDSMLKVYRGTACNAGGDPYQCFNNGSDGKPDQVVGWIAPGDGWITIVVDGRMAFAEDGDWGPYSLEVRLTCLRPDCCCPKP